MLRVALKMLLGDRAKYVGLLFGIAFTSFLVTFAASYFCGFMTRGFRAHRRESDGRCVGHGSCSRLSRADHQHAGLSAGQCPQC